MLSSTARPVSSLLAFIAACALAASVSAAEPTPPFAVSECADSAGDREADDQRALDAAIAAFNGGGFAALTPHLPALRAVMKHAPSCYPRIERRDDQVIVRTADLSEYLILSAVLAAAAEEGGPRMAISMAPNVYPRASFILGAHANEMRRHQEALAWLERGLALQPDDQLLISERAAALMALQRPAEAYAILQAALDNAELSLTLDRPRFLRIAGVVLIELNRLHEAEAALNESIRLQPDNPGARRELEYIAELRAGGAQRAVQLVTPETPQK